MADRPFPAISLNEFSGAGEDGFHGYVFGDRAVELGTSYTIMFVAAHSAGGASTSTVLHDGGGDEGPSTLHFVPVSNGFYELSVEHPGEDGVGHMLARDQMPRLRVYAVTRDDTSVTYTIDGREFDKGASVLEQNTPPFSFGELGMVRKEGKRSFRGKLAEVLVFDEALDEDEILQLTNYLGRKYRVMTP